MNARTPEESALVFGAATAHGQSKYLDGMRTSYDIYQRIVLPPRGRAGSRVNQTRSRLLQAALHQAKWGKGQLCDRKRKTGRCVLCATRVRLRPVGTAPESAHVKPRRSLQHIAANPPRTDR